MSSDTKTPEEQLPLNPVESEKCDKELENIDTVVTTQPEKLGDSGDILADTKPLNISGSETKSDCDCDTWLPVLACCSQMQECIVASFYAITYCCNPECCIQICNGTCEGFVECLQACGECCVLCAACGS